MRLPLALQGQIRCFCHADFPILIRGQSPGNLETGNRKQGNVVAAVWDRRRCCAEPRRTRSISSRTWLPWRGPLIFPKLDLVVKTTVGQFRSSKKGRDFLHCLAIRSTRNISPTRRARGRLSKATTRTLLPSKARIQPQAATYVIMFAMYACCLHIRFLF